MTPAELAARGLRVKPLVWVKNPDVGEGGFLATGLFGLAYHVADDGWSLHRQMIWHAPEGIDDPKAAAEAHYTAAIAAQIGGADD
jgi:hypothetical protein